MAHNVCAAASDEVFERIPALVDTHPVVASGPMLTTATDMWGFFVVLSQVSAMMPLLVG